MQSRPWTVGAALALSLLSGGTVPSASLQHAPSTDQWAAWVEPDFPFFSSVLDAGNAGAPFPSPNLTPRGLVLNLGGDCWVAFDVDLLRVAAIWGGRGVTPRALAPGSYHAPDKKTPGGQLPAPEPDGTVWLANGIYPGWHSGDRPSLVDPREPAPTREEVGRGPLPEQHGRFKAIRVDGAEAVLEYSAFGTEVRESFAAIARDDSVAVERRFQLGPSTAPLVLALGIAAAGSDVTLGRRDASPFVSLVKHQPSAAPGAGDAGSPVWTVQIAPHAQPVDFSVRVAARLSATTASQRSRPVAAPRWPEEVTGRITRSSSTDPYVVDDIELPAVNPWRRNIRPGDVQFLKDGTGVVVTIDGDVWFVRRLDSGDGIARWRRFASGLHEPLTAAIRDDQVYVFDRNGIWRLRDTNGDGEADVHELFSNGFAQTADMREFPSTIRTAPDGEFVIAKGGQEATTIGKHNGSVLRISADGRRTTVLGYGFRQPNISVNPRTGLVLASDQQGHYIPTTPLHVVRDRQFYGFLSDKLPKEVYPAPIAEPLTWIPHAANASAMSQVWTYGAQLGPLNDGLVHIGFNNPELFRVLLNERGSRLQAAVVSVTRAFDFPTLNGSINPADGQLYVAGFQILGWGTTASRLTGMGRVRYTGAPFTGPRAVVPMDKGVLLRFDVALDPERAINPDNYSVTSWRYKRTFNYGSPQFKSDGTPGIDRLTPGRAYVSKDGRAVFVTVPGLAPVMQMRVGWTLATAVGQAFQDSAYFTPYELTRFDPQAEGFGDLTVDMSPRAAAADASAPVSAVEGRRLYQLYGCMACHAIEATTVSRLGPSWKGLYGSERSYAKGVLRARADEAYLRESILEPVAKVVTGYERGESGMPSYAGVLTAPQIESLILFIKTLK